MQTPNSCAWLPARGLSSGAAVCAWVILGATGLGYDREEVSAQTREAKVVFQTLYGGAERAYRSHGSRGFGGPGLEASAKRLKGEPSIRSQRRGVV